MCECVEARVENSEKITYIFSTSKNTATHIKVYKLTVGIQFGLSDSTKRKNMHTVCDDRETKVRDTSKYAQRN